MAENPLTPDNLGGMNTLRSRQEFVLAPEEAIYGLGQHQNGLMNYRGATVHLQQRNPGRKRRAGFGFEPWLRNPLGQSGHHQRKRRRGRGTDDSRRSTLHRGPARPAVSRPDITGEKILTRWSPTARMRQVDFDWSDTPPSGLPHDHYSVRWDGFVEAREGGPYTFITSGDDGVRLWIDDRQVIDDWGVSSGADGHRHGHFRRQQPAPHPHGIFSGRGAGSCAPGLAVTRQKLARDVDLRGGGGD